MVEFLIVFKYASDKSAENKSSSALLEAFYHTNPLF